MTPTIIGISDGTHYLVGATDNDDNFVALSSLQEITLCHSLSSAKQLLKDNHINTAQLTLQSAYDEMCGLPASHVCHQTITF